MKIIYALFSAILIGIIGFITALSIMDIIYTQFFYEAGSFVFFFSYLIILFIICATATLYLVGLLYKRSDHWDIPAIIVAGLFGLWATQGIRVLRGIFGHMYYVDAAGEIRAEPGPVFLAIDSFVYGSIGFLPLLFFVVGYLWMRRYGKIIHVNGLLIGGAIGWAISYMYVIMDRKLNNSFISYFNFRDNEMALVLCAILVFAGLSSWLGKKWTSKREKVK